MCQVEVRSFKGWCNGVIYKIQGNYLVNISLCEMHLSIAFVVCAENHDVWQLPISVGKTAESLPHKRPFSHLFLKSLSALPAINDLHANYSCDNTA